MSILISDELLQAANMSDAELKTELAILLYQQKNWGYPRHESL
jgi:predicted HTH domain antitoxin